jgi:hypothetical protein
MQGGKVVDGSEAGPVADLIDGDCPKGGEVSQAVRAPEVGTGWE